MPAAAVIPAPIAYIKIAAVKASVVGFRPIRRDVCLPLCQSVHFLFRTRVYQLTLLHSVTLSKLECSNQAIA